jgi:hypothetical protein
VYDVEELDSSTRLIRLKMADQMPRHNIAAEFKDFRISLLHPILAEIGDSGIDGTLHNARRVRLTNGDELYIERIAPRSAGAFLNAATHLCQALAYLIRTGRFCWHDFY